MKRWLSWFSQQWLEFESLPCYLKAFYVIVLIFNFCFVKSWIYSIKSSLIMYIKYKTTLEQFFLIIMYPAPSIPGCIMSWEAPCSSVLIYDIILFSILIRGFTFTQIVDPWYFFLQSYIPISLESILKQLSKVSTLSHYCAMLV